MANSDISAPNKCNSSLGEIVLKSALVHTATYFIFGLAAFYTFDYARTFATGDLAVVMRPVSDPIVMAGPMFQPVRGALFGVVFFLLKDILFVRKNGWLTIWAMLAIIGILGTFGPAPGSIEGALYTKFPLSYLYSFSLLEVYGQALALAAGVYFWVQKPDNRLLGWGFSIVGSLGVLLPLAGLLIAPSAS